MLNKIFIRLSLFVILATSCVDRINFDVEIGTSFPIAIDGFISNEPGPYEVRVSKAFDIESKQSLRVPINVRSITLHTSEGITEEFSKVSDGIYQTSATGIQGEIGRAYKIRIELLDGRIYESIPDTLKAAGTVDNVYYEFTEEPDSDGAVQYGFDVFFNSSTQGTTTPYFLWKFVGTYQVETNPELYEVSCGESKCPQPLPCSSHILVNGNLMYVKDCECCSCWVDFFNDLPIISDNQFISGGAFKNIKAGYVPVNQWTFMHKVHVEVRQFSLSRQAFRFWKGIKDQKESTTSLFQPVSGKIASNFIQISGEKGAIEGIFYASGISKNSAYITRNDVSPQSIIPSQNLPFKDACTKLFPHSKSQKPDYWVD